MLQKRMRQRKSILLSQSRWKVKSTSARVMFAGGGPLPQWIEISNGSRTEQVNLSGWTLTIENTAVDADVSVGAKATFTILGRHEESIRVVRTIFRPRYSLLLNRDVPTLMLVERERARFSTCGRNSRSCYFCSMLRSVGIRC